MGQFKFVTIAMGSGWLSGHVAVDDYHTWPNNDPARHICLNGDTQNFEEFSSEIDRLIAELEDVRKTAKRVFSSPRHS